MSSRGNATHEPCSAIPLTTLPPGKDDSALSRQGLADLRRTCQTRHDVPHSIPTPHSVRLRDPPSPCSPIPVLFIVALFHAPIFIVVVVVVLRTLLVALLVLSPRDFTAVSATELEQFLAPKLALVGATLIVVSHQLSGLETLKEKYVLTYGPHRPPTIGVGYRQSYVQRELY